MLGFIFFCMCFFLTFSSTPGWTADSSPGLADSTKKALDALVTPRLFSEKNTAGIPGMVVGAITPNYRAIVGYGSKTFGKQEVPDGETVFEIGSLTKVFTGLILALEVEKRKISLSDAADKFLPASASVPDWRGKKFSIEDLATHHSGLPFYPVGSKGPLTDDEWRQGAFTETQLFAFLKATKLLFSPGEKYEYSNFGYGLLGYILARVEKMNLADLFLKEISLPMGLQDTRIKMDPSQTKRLATGYDQRSGRIPSPPYDTGVLGGSGLLHSTAADLLSFENALMNPSSDRLGKAVKLMETPRTSGVNGSIGLGLEMTEHHTPRLGNFFYHAGGTQGYSSFMGFSKEKHAGIIILCNCAYNRFPNEPLTEVYLSVARLIIGGVE
jgi:serine-type D-Ala-D-Ala carboxypeptidase/endopeptidase